MQQRLDGGIRKSRRSIICVLARKCVCGFLLSIREGEEERCLLGVWDRDT